ncbi:nucleotidyl transferase AbiEii/AbiGii toxin family protein [Salmonella enterica]|nr:nucleotidyl transferase AbiEii/AbiGii toxin family protein [Salmonella enterica]
MVDKISPEEQAKIDAAIKALDETKQKMVENLDKILTESQKVVEPHLQQVTDKGFVLAGGLAVGAGTNGGRKSDDFDYIGKFEFDPEQLKSELDFSGLTTDHTIESKNTLEFIFSVPQGTTKELVKVSMFGKPDMTLQTLTDLQGYTFTVAHPLDIFATKLAVLTNRTEWKDYTDIVALINFSGYTLQQALNQVPIVFNADPKDAPAIIRNLAFLLAGAYKVPGVKAYEVTVIERELKRFGWL